MFSSNDKIVDAIEDGRIVSVPEEYAKKEGLLILRRFESPKTDDAKMREHMKISPRLIGDRKIYADLDKYRRPLRMSNEIRNSLVDNFHWLLQGKRKQLNLSRKQVASALNVSEEDVKMLENGVLPSNDYVLINKFESYYGMNLRKDPNSINLPAMRNIKPATANVTEKEKDDSSELLSSEIDIEED